MSLPTPVDYAAIKHVLSHEHTENLHDRHIELIKQWCDARSQGLYVSELQDVCDVLAILLAKAQATPAVYDSGLCAVVNICNQPLIEQKARELLRPTGLAMFSTFLNNVTQLLWLPNTALKMNVVAFIRRVAGGKLSTVDLSQRSSNQDEDRPTDQSVARQLLRQSGAIGALANMFMSLAQAHLASVRRFHEDFGTLSTADDDNAAYSYLMNEMSEAHANDAPLPSTDSLATSSQDELKTTWRGELAKVTQLSSATIPTLLYLSEDDACAGVLVEHGLINSIAMLLGVAAEANRKQLADYVQILWNCCEACKALQRPANQQRPQHGVSPISPDVIDFHIVVSELVSLFVAIQHECFRKAYKAIRNEVLIVLGLLTRARQGVVELLRCQGIEAILTYSCAAEATAPWAGFLSPTASVRNFGTATELDVEMKGLLWALIIQITAHNMHIVNLLIAESPFVQVLLEYVASSSQELAAPDAMSAAPSEPRSLSVDDWSVRSPVLMRQGVDVTTQLLPTQVADLQLQAMAVLVKVCKYCVAEVRRLDGVATLMSAITEHSPQPQQSSRLMVEYALIVLAQLVEQSKLVVDELINSDVVAACISRFHEFDSNCKIRALQLVVALSSSRRRQDVQAAFCEAHGVHALTEILRVYCARHAPPSPSKIAAATASGTLNPASSVQFGSLTLSSIEPQLAMGPISTAGNNVLGSEDELLLVAVLDCLWATVVGDERNEDVFVEAHGVDDLLAVFEAVPAHMRPQVLAFLSDMLERSEMAAYVHGWRSTPTLRSFAQLLCAAWIDEEVRLGCFRPDGIIADLDHPLGCHAWDAPGSHSTAGISVQSPAFARLNEALQASRAAVNDGKEEQAAESTDKDAEQRDIRCVLASVLEKLGYTQLQYLQHARVSSEQRNNSDTEAIGLPNMLAKALQVSPDELGLSTSDKQVMVLARRYRILREGEGWKELQENLHRSKVVPIAADAHVMQQHLRTSFQQAQAVQFEQMQLLAEGRSCLEAQEQHFFGQILRQREALEKQAMLKSKMKLIKPRKVELRRPTHVSFDMTSATTSTIISYD